MGLRTKAKFPTLPTEIKAIIFSYLTFSEYLFFLINIKNFTQKTRDSLLCHYTKTIIKSKTSCFQVIETINQYISNDSYYKICLTLLDTLLFLANYKVDYPDILKQTVIKNNVNLTKYFLKKIKCDKYFLLNLAAKYAAVDIIKYLVEEEKMDISWDKDYPLMLSIANGCCKTSFYIYSQYLKIHYKLNVKNLIKNCVLSNNHKTINCILKFNDNKESLIDAILIQATVYNNQEIFEIFSVRYIGKIKPKTLEKIINIACCSGNYTLLQKILDTFGKIKCDKERFLESLYIHSHEKMTYILNKFF
jgi:hypothetical protein